MALIKLHISRINLRSQQTLLKIMPSINRVTSEHELFYKYQKIFFTVLNLSLKESKKIFTEHHDLFQIPKARFLNNCNIIKNYNIRIDSGVENFSFLKLHEKALEDRILLLKEMGVQKLLPHILVTTGGQLPMKLFKAFTGISSDTNVAENLYSYLHKPPAHVAPLEHLDDILTVFAYRQKCLEHYLCWRLEFPNESLNLSPLAHSLRYRSYARLKKSFDILHKRIGILLETIRNCKCLVDCSPDDLEKILDKIGSICGVSIAKLILKDPKLHKIKYETVERLKPLLETHKFTGQQLENCPKILLLDADFIQQQVDTFANSRALKSLIKHPKVLYIFLPIETLQTRLEYCNYLNMKNLTVTMLQRSKTGFENFIRNQPHAAIGKDIAVTLSPMLEMDSSDIKEQLKKNSNWLHVNLATIYDTIEYLKSRFELSDIKKNLQLILYNKETVAAILDDVTKENDAASEADRYTMSQLLALCLYHIEKKYSFSNDGIWAPTKKADQIIV